MRYFLLLLCVIFLNACHQTTTNAPVSRKPLEIGDKIDSLHGVIVYYNGSMNNVEGRRISADGYNIGLKYQCVEFVKRYYFQKFNHKMPNSYGHAKDFYDPHVKDGDINAQRNLYQFTNPSKTKPKVSDLIVYDGSTFNPYGHVAIVSKVYNDKIEIIQQNVGGYNATRTTIGLSKKNGKWTLNQTNIKAWLRK